MSDLLPSEQASVGKKVERIKEKRRKLSDGQNKDSLRRRLHSLRKKRKEKDKRDN